ncbi:hypothetical protein TWF730_007575 [Orbilia blumenaviensis]|uniref:Uncharacterized protein n=1 Tax=Orbilia blumenaviensis TaxID=1796055 RepID=A0AAV9VEM8_9PEZI
MKILVWPKLMLAGAYLLLQNRAPLFVLADNTEISISQLEAFIQANSASIIRFQEAMRAVSLLWDEDCTRVDQPDIPLTLDTLREKLKEKLRRLTAIVDDDPKSARAIFNGYGFADNPIPKENVWGWDDTPTNRVFYPILMMLTESLSARQIFWGFFRWADSRIGLRHWISVPGPPQTDYEWVAPKLFGGSIYNRKGIFTYDPDDRIDNRKQLDIYTQILEGLVSRMQDLVPGTFRMGPKLDLGADFKFLFEDIIKNAIGFRNGVREVRDTYIAIPPLPGADDPDVENDTDDLGGASKIPHTLQKKIMNAPDYPDDTKILNIPEFQFEASDRASDHGLLRSLPAYVETDFDLLSAAPDCSLEEGVVGNSNARPNCRIF